MMRFLRRRNSHTQQPSELADTVPLVDGSRAEGSLRSDSRRHRWVSSLQARAGRFKVGLHRWVGHLLHRYTLTVCLDGGVARVVVFNGMEVVAWGTTGVSGHVPGETDELGARTGWPTPELRALLKDLPSSGGRTVFSLPYHAVLMRRFRLPKMKRRYLSQAVSSEVTEVVPFSGRDMDLVWQYKPADTGYEAFAAVASKEAIDREVRLAKEGGLRPRAAYSRDAAMAFAVGVPDVIVIDVGLRSAAIVLVIRGVPKVVHQVDFLEEAIDPGTRGEMVAKAVQQVSSYHLSSDGASQGERLPMVLTGKAAGQGHLVAVLEAMPGHRVLPFASPFVFPAHFPAHEYAVNLGLAQADRTRAKSQKKLRGHRRPSLNLLSERHLPRSLPTVPLAVLVSLSLFGYVAYQLTGQIATLSDNRDQLSSQVVNLERQARGQRLSVARAAAAQKRILEMAELSAGLDGRLGGLDIEMSTLLTQMAVATEVAPTDRVSLTSLALQQDSLALAGGATAYEDITRYASSLRASRAFADVKVVRVQRTGEVGLLGGAPEDAARSVTFQIKAFTGPPIDDPTARSRDLSWESLLDLRP